MNEALAINFYATATESIPVRRNQTKTPSRTLIAWVCWLARDNASPHLVNFPFAIALSLTFTAAVAGFCWGVILMNTWLAAGGFLLALVVGTLYGLIHWED